MKTTKTILLVYLSLLSVTSDVAKVGEQKAQGLWKLFRIDEILVSEVIYYLFVMQQQNYVPCVRQKYLFYKITIYTVYE